MSRGFPHPDHPEERVSEDTALCFIQPYPMHIDRVSRDSLEVLDLLDEDLLLVQDDRSRCLNDDDSHGCIIILFALLFIWFYSRQFD